MLDRVFAILGSEWLIHQDTAISYLPVLMAFMKGQDFLLKKYEENPNNVYSKATGSQIFTAGRWDLEDQSMPENSVAILSLQGPLGNWDYSDLFNSLRKVKMNDRINSVLLQVNSPGGMVSGIEMVTNSISLLGKPTVVVITGMAASAAMWIASSASYRVALSKLDLVGSIGTKISFRDFSGLFEKLGIKSEDVYATKSTRKDEFTRRYKDGDTEAMQQFVDFANEVFHQAIMNNLGIKEDSEALTGAIFYAEKALELGLINEISSLDAALEKAYLLGLKNKIIVSSKSLNF